MSLKLFREEARKGLKSPCYVLYSEDPYFLYEAKRMIKETVPPEARDFSLSIFDAEEGFEADALLNTLKAVPFMGGRMTVLVEAAHEVKEKELAKIKAYCAAPLAESLLVLLMETKKEPAGFGKAKCMSLAIGDVQTWIREKAAGEGLTLSVQAVNYLAGEFGTEPGLLPMEIKKLALLGKPSIGVEDIRALAESMAGYGAFDLVNAFRSKDVNAVFKLCKEVSGRQQAIIMLMGALNREFERRKLPPAKKDELYALLAERDIMARAQSAVYPIEELFIRLLALAG